MRERHAYYGTASLLAALSACFVAAAVQQRVGSEARAAERAAVRFRLQQLENMRWATALAGVDVASEPCGVGRHGTRPGPQLGHGCPGTAANPGRDSHDGGSSSRRAVDAAGLGDLRPNEEPTSPAYR